MQYYTKQQLQGSVKFSPKCLVGNWNEDVEVQDVKSRDFLHRKETGSLKLDEYQRRMSVALCEFELTKIKNDEHVHFGDLVQIGNSSHVAVLSGDIMDKDLRAGEHSFAVTATNSLCTPFARNTFIFAKYKPRSSSAYDTYYSDDTLKYGQKIRVMANPAISGEALDACGGRRPLCLYSRPLTTTHGAKYSRHQLVGLTPRLGYDTVWEVRPTDPEAWIPYQGQPVRALEPITLVHCSTNQSLRLEDAVYPNDFGLEWEVSAHSLISTSKKSVLVHACKGEFRGSMEKPVASPNHWVIITGDKIEALPRPQSNALDVQEVLARIRHTASNAGIQYSGIRQKLFMLDKDGSGSVLKEEFLIALKCCNINIEEEELSLLMDFFAAQDANCINVRAFFSEFEALEL